MNKALLASSGIKNNLNQNFEFIRAAPDCAKISKSETNRSLALIAMSVTLFAAFLLVSAVIGTSSANAATLPAFSAANALAAKQSASVGGFAIGSIAVAALVAFFATLVPQKKRPVR